MIAAKMVSYVVSRGKSFLENEKGSLGNMVWLLGMGVVALLIIVGMMVYAPQTAQTIWNDFITYLHTSLGF